MLDLLSTCAVSNCSVGDDILLFLYLQELPISLNYWINIMNLTRYIGFSQF